MKGYPRWFSPFSKPTAPFKPRKTLVKHETVYSGELYNKQAILSLVKDWAGEEYSWVFNAYDSYGDTTVSVNVTRTVEEPNPRYGEQLANYKKDYAAYRERLKEWKPYFAKWKAEEAAKQEAADRRRLEALKKKLGET